MSAGLDLSALTSHQYARCVVRNFSIHLVCNSMNDLRAASRVPILSTHSILSDDEKAICGRRPVAGPDCGLTYCPIHYCHYSHNGSHRRYGVYVCKRKDGSIPRKSRLCRPTSMLPRSKIINNQPSPGQGVTRVYEMYMII